MINLKELYNTIKQGDVLDVLRELPDNCFDLTITSPPYNKRNKSHGWLVTNEKYAHFDDHMPEDDYQSWQVDVISELFRITKPGGSLFYNHKLRWVDGVMLHPVSWVCKTPWSLRQEIIWDRGLAANMRGWRYWQVDERIYWLYKPIGNYHIGEELASKHAKLSSIWRIRPAARSKLHPAAFPIELPARIIFSFSAKQRLFVLDPFCGTSTTLVAAKLLNCDYFGIDLSPDYVTLSEQRLENADSERGTVESETKKHVIDDSFAERKKRGTISWPYGPKPTNGTEE